MPVSDYLVDTNILIYHTSGSQRATDFITKHIANHSFKLSILTKIEFLGWDQHTAEGFEKCKTLLDAATAILNNMKLVIRNVDDFKAVEGLEIVNIFE